MAEYQVAKRPERKPTHPGAVLADMLEDIGLSVSAFSRGIHLSRQQVHKILAENAPVTPEGWQALVPVFPVQYGLILTGNSEYPRIKFERTRTG